MLVRERIAAACRRAGRSPDDVTLVGVSKGFPVEAIEEALAAGLREVGENRVQEAAAKIQALAVKGLAPRWHLIGHLQTNCGHHISRTTSGEALDQPLAIVG